MYEENARKVAGKKGNRGVGQETFLERMETGRRKASKESAMSQSAEEEKNKARKVSGPGKGQSPGR